MGSIRLVSHTTKPDPEGKGTLHVLVITPDPRRFPLWMLRKAIGQSILTAEGEVVERSSTGDGNLRLVVKSIAGTRQLLESSGQLPDIYRCLPQTDLSYRPAAHLHGCGGGSPILIYCYCVYFIL